MELWEGNKYGGDEEEERGKGGRGTGLQQGRGGGEQKFRRVPSTGERVVKRGHVYPGLPLHESDQRSRF